MCGGRPWSGVRLSYILYGRWLTDALFLLFSSALCYIISPMVVDDGGR